MLTRREVHRGTHLNPITHHVKNATKRERDGEGEEKGGGERGRGRPRGRKENAYQVSKDKVNSLSGALKQCSR